jgi:hypothetical protein
MWSRGWGGLAPLRGFGGVAVYNIKMEEVHIGHYILGKTIGTGGFAKVKCTHAAR